VVSPQQVARDTAEIGLVRLVGVLAVLTPSLALIQAVVNARDYRLPAVAIVVWLAVLGIGIWFTRRPHAGGLTARETVAAAAVAVGVVAALGAVHRPSGDPGSVNLAILGTVWLLVLIAVSHSVRVWVPIALLVFVVQGFLLIRQQGVTLLSLSQVGGAGYIIATILIAFAAFRPTLDLHVGLAARQAALASRAAAKLAAADAVGQERRNRLAILEQEALPLLRGIADGTLDLGAAEVGEQCARHAAILRQALTEGAPTGELMASLEQVLQATDAADVRGRSVTVQVIGDPGRPPPSVARAVRAALTAVLTALPPQQMVLTVLAASDEVELYLAFDMPARTAPDLTRLGLDVPAAARWRAALSTAETGEGFLEVSWRKDGAGV
jgi:hypothetical protein